VTRFSCDGEEILCGGWQALPDIDDWKDMAEKAKGSSIKVEVYASHDGKWTKYKPFDIFVSPDSIDTYLSYRLISPSYVTYEELTLSQRCLENYDESVMVDNMLCGTETQGQCVNCHNYQMYNPSRMQFHARQNHGGTIIAYDGKIEKINMKNDSIISAGVYPAWHPTEKLIAYSTDKTAQVFHTGDINKIEVFDSESDLILFDIDKNEVSNIEADTAEFEVYPAWSPDGKYLYYCSAHIEYKDTVPHDQELMLHLLDIRYSIYRKSFDVKTRSFGPRELVFDAAAQGKSATLPRISPDGRFLLFSLAKEGCFHIWHKDADLWMIDLQKGSEAAPLKRANSDECESYHTWSSNGRWIVFSSRRDDGNFTRPFIAHIDKDGNDTKAFELPQADPNFHREFLKSYNIPEFMKGKVTVTPQQFAKILKTDGREPVKFRSK